MRDSDTPSCTVVICTRDRTAELERALSAVARLDYPRFDVLVVDSASRDRCAQDVAARWGARSIREPFPGVNRARNLAARACQTELVAFLDDEAVPEPGWLSGLACEFSDPLVMAAVGRILALSVETEAQRFFASVGGFDFRQERCIVDRQTPFWFELANFSALGNEAGMAIRRRAFEAWPGFDERLGPGRILRGCDGQQAIFSLIDRGYRVVYTPHAVVRHPYPHTFEELRARHLRDLAAAGGYITLLLVEEARYRKAVIRYVLEGLQKRPRIWRGELARTRIVPRWRMLLAWLSGPFLYVWSRISRQ